MRSPLISAGTGPRSIWLLHLGQPIAGRDCRLQNLWTPRLCISANQSLQDLSGVEDGRLRFVSVEYVVQSCGKSSARYLQGKQPLRSKVRCQCTGAISGLTPKVVQRRDDVTRNFRIRFRISGEKAVVSSDAAIATLSMKHPAKQRAQSFVATALRD